MTRFKIFILVLFSTINLYAQLPNDCANAIVVCGNGNFSSNATGFGVQEVAGCGGFEHNSIWIKINIVTTGTLGFNLVPNDPSILVDYDFWVYGPNVTCGTLGSPIRCCTTNPNLAGLSSNITGMDNSTLTTTSGPGANGTGFVKWLDVVAGQSYYICIDRPVGDGGFELQWTGSTMTTGGGAFPTPPVANSIGELRTCSSTPNQGIFNLNTARPLINPDLVNNTITFHTSLANAVDGTNPLPNIFANDPLQNPQTIYAKVKNNSSGCSSITTFLLRVLTTPDANIAATPTSVCPGGNATTTFIGTPGAVIEYRINGGPLLMATLDASGVFQISGPVATTTVYTLVRVKTLDTDNVTILCSKIKNTTATVTVTGVPAPTVSATSPVCFGSNVTYDVSGAANAQFSYTIDGGSTQTATLNASGQYQINLVGLPAGSHTLDISSITDPNPPFCVTTTNVSSVVVVQPDLTANVLTSNSLCSGTATTVNFTGTPNATITYTVNAGSNQTIVLDNSGNASLTTAVLTTNQTYQLVNVLTSVPACTKAVTNSATITIIAQPTVSSFTGTTSICSGSSTNLNFVGTPNATVTYSNGTTNQTVVLDNFGNATVSISPTTNTTYSLVSVEIASTPVCSSSASGNVTVTVNSAPQAGTDGTTAICETSSTTIDLYSLITGEQAGGTWTRTSGTGGTFNAAAGTFTPAIGASTSDFTYTLAGTAPCVGDSSIATITISQQPNAGTGGNLLFCETDTSVIDLYGLITGEQTGGTWTRTSGTGGTFNAVAGTFAFAVGVTNSSFTYTIVGTAPCVNSSSVVSMTIAQQPNAGTDGAIVTCESSTTTIDLFGLISGEQAGGTWTRTSGTGGSFNATAGKFTPAAGVTNSTFTYTLTGVAPCVNDSSVATITFTAQPNAGADGGTAICESSTAVIDLYSLITGEQTGGTWVRTSGTGGLFNAVAGTFTPTVGANTSTFKYTLTATAPCADDSSVATVTISASPTNITISGSTTTCAGIPVNLTVTATPGTIITWTGTPSSFTIGASGSNTIPVSPSVNTTYTLTSASLNGCTIPVVGQSATVSVSTTPQFITQIPDVTVCNGAQLNIASQLTSTVPGTTFNWSASYANTIGKDNLGSIITSGDENNIDQFVSLVNNLQGGTITILVSPQIGSCSGTPQEIVVTVNPIPTILSIVADKTTVCNNEFVALTSNSNPAASSYNWQINTANGVQIVGGATNGTSTTGIVNLQLALTNPLVAGTISFNFTPVNGNCSGATVTSVTITVNPIPGNPIGLPQPEICSGETTNINVSENLLIPGTMLQWQVVNSNNVSGFSQTGSGLAPISIHDVLVNTSDVQGFVTYRITSVIGQCQGSSTDITVLVNPLPKPMLTDGHICVNQSTGVTYQGYVLDTQLSNPNYSYEWYLFNTTTNAYDLIGSANTSTYEATIAGNYQVIVTNNLTNCYADASADIMEIYPATAFTTLITDAFTDNATITVTVNPIGTGNLVYAIDNGAWQSSNIFTGVEGGTHTILVTDLEGCTNLSQTVEVIDFPKYFTPNGDGIHDTWNIAGLNQRDAKLYIFDRYGKLIKQLIATDGSQGWDGTFNGQQAPSSDYWFTIDYTENNQQKQFKSHFSLKR